MKKKLYKIISLCSCIPKSLYFNFKSLPIQQAIKLPILVGNNVELWSIHKGCVILKGKISFGSIRLGIDKGSIGIHNNRHSIIYLPGNSNIIFQGNASICKGFTIRCGKNGFINFGNNFFSNQNCSFFSGTSIIFGDNVLIGWNVQSRDSDGHRIYYLENKQQIINENKPIIIGDHVWISAYSSILKGVNIGSNNVVGYKSLLTKSFILENTIIAGSPAKIVKSGINWKI